jgi:hypothetical protein
MTREQFLEQLGMNAEDFRSLMRKLAAFMELLDPAERAVISRSLPGLTEAAQTFSPSVNPTELGKVLRGLLGDVLYGLIGCHSTCFITPRTEGQHVQARVGAKQAVGLEGPTKAKQAAKTKPSKRAKS